MNNNLISKARKRKNLIKGFKTETIINEIFALSDKKYKVNSEISAYMNELKGRDNDEIYSYYRQYISRVINEEVEFKRINPYYALNEVIKLGEASKIWDFVGVLETLASEHNFKIDYEKVSKAIADTNDLAYNLYWAECYPIANRDNIEVVIDSKHAYFITRLVTLVSNLTPEDIQKAIKIVKASKNSELKKELKESLENKNLNSVKQ